LPTVIVILRIFCTLPVNLDEEERSFRTLALVKGRMTQLGYVLTEATIKWADEVSCRLRSCIDLVAVEARYHRNCSKNFSHIHTQNKRGRPLDSAKEDAFNKMCEWLETTDRDLLTLAELNESAKTVSGLDCMYSEKWLQSKLLERYGSSIFFADVNGRKNVICWRNIWLHL
jgi:hypothetical protein